MCDAGGLTSLLVRGAAISLIGGGGKTSAMQLLACLCRARGLSVLITTSTRIEPAVELVHDALITPHANEVDFIRQLMAARQRGIVLAVARGAGDGKSRGFAPELLAAVHRAHVVDVLVCEADGARRLPLKGFAEHEPVPVPGSTVVAVVGVDALTHPLDDAHVFRPHLFAAVSGCTAGATPTPAHVAAALLARDGYSRALRLSGAACPLVVVLNKVDVLPAGRDNPLLQELRRILEAAGVTVHLCALRACLARAVREHCTAAP